MASPVTHATNRTALPVGRALAAFDRHMERNAGRWLLVVAALAGLLLAVLTYARPLDHDEIYTVTLARLSSPTAIHQALLAGADLHPPLDPWIRHVFMRLLGNSDFAFRVPSLLLFLLSLGCTFALARMHWGSMAGFVAVSVLLVSQANSYAYFGRPYSGMVLWTAAGLLFWRWAGGGRRALGLAGLAAIFATAPLLHYYTPVHLVAIAVAELVRTIRRQAIDWLMWAAFGAAAAGLLIALPLIRFASSFSKGFWTPISLDAALAIYRELFLYAVPAVFGVLAAYALARIALDRAPEAEPVRVHDAGAPELAAALYLMALPFVVFAIAKAGTGALWPRYCVSMVLGVALLAGFAAAHSAAFRLACTAVLPAFALLMIAGKAAAAARTGGPGPETREIYEIVRQTELPVVIDAPQPFLETAYYAGADVRARLFFLLDAAAAYRIRRQNTDQKGFAAFAPYTPYQIVPLERFVRDHPRFLLVYANGWLLHKLSEDGARIAASYHGRTLLITVTRPGVAP